jgi:hypothetical protein
MAADYSRRADAGKSFSFHDTGKVSFAAEASRLDG